MAYLLTMLLTLPLALLWQHQAGRIHPYPALCSCLAFLPIYTLYAFQYSVHSDYDNYRIMFNQIKGGIHAIRDPAIYLLNLLIGRLGLPFQTVYILIYLFAFFFLALCIADYSSDFAMSMMLFMSIYFMLGFYYIRQLAAVALSLYAYRFITVGKPASGASGAFPYFLLASLASLCHTSALVLFPLYFLLKYDFTLSWYLFFILLFAILTTMQESILTKLVWHFIPSYFGKHEMFRSFAFNPWDLLWVLLIMSISLAGEIIHPSPYNALNHVFRNALRLYLIIFFLGRWLLEFERFAYYLSCPTIFLIPNVLTAVSDRNLRRFLKLSISLFSVWIFIMKHSGTDAWNYVSIFSR